jgi:hypothetical protein
MSITGGPGRGPVTDVASPYLGGPNSDGGSADNTEEPDRRRQVVEGESLRETRRENGLLGKQRMEEDRLYRLSTHRTRCGTPRANTVL